MGSIVRWMKSEIVWQSINEALLTILENNRSLQLLISDEIGYGLVPIDDFEREYREFHGRVMTELAEQADCVERVVCGIPQRIK